ncbi:MAG: tyrosine--tRNA ligase [Candidatus Levybacteria bacterium]|nr:tyrosine--tRNA ligase [Candidatus Levybacteria bacterium]
MDKIEELLTRGVDKIYPSKDELEKVLRSGKKLKLYQGFDPTGTKLHIGHMVGFRKLRQWQDLGHHVIFLIGDGTGQAGDPSGKTTARDKFLTREELRDNAVDYVKQAGKIVNFDGENPVEILFNGDWLNDLDLVDILEIAGHFTWQQLSERDLFQERIKNHQPINLREFLYPLLQAYDSVAMDVDLELGGSDQTFNMLSGRNLMKSMKNKDKFVMTTPLLEDSEGRKIGKTEGNVIALTDSPETLYRKIMALGDEIIVKGLEYLTGISMTEISEIKKKIKNEENPIQFKKRLAFEVTKQLNSDADAKRAEEEFERVVQNKEVPADALTLKINIKQPIITVESVLVDNNLASSKSEAKRLIEQGGVSLDNERITDPNIEIKPSNNSILKVGKKIVKLVIK